jgi:hypothetical protein
MKILLAPLQKLADLLEVQNQKISEMHQLLSVDLVKASTQSNKELSTHTVLLGDIKKILEKQSKREEEKAKERKGGNIKMPGVASAIKGAFAIVLMAGAIVAASGILGYIQPITPAQFATAIAIGLVMAVLAPTFMDIAASFKGGGLMQRILAKFTLGNANAGSIMSGGFSGALKTLGGIGLSMIVMALGVTVSSWIFSLIIPVSFAKIVTAALIGIAMAPMGTAFGQFAKAMRQSRMATTPNGLKQLGMVAAAMVIMSGAIVLVSWIFQAMPTVGANLPSAEWIIKTGVILYLFTWSFAKLATVTKRMTWKSMIMAAAAIPLIAVSIVLTGFIFAFMEAVSGWVAPPIDWTLKAGLAIAIFAIPFAIIAKLADRLSFVGMIKAMIAAPLIAISILAVAWIFQILPTNFIAPPLDWSMSAGIAILIFAIPFAIVAALSMAITPVGLVFGALGIILIAGAMFVVAWIFAGLPDLSAIAKNFTDAIMYPVNAMIDALLRIKDEIGVENLLPLAGGLFAIAGGWLALVAALAGQAAGGLFSSVANLGTSIIDGIGSLFGGSKTKTPIELLDMLIGRTAGIIALANPVKTLGIEFVKIAANTNAVIKGIGAVLQLADEDNAENLTTSGKAMTEIAKAYTSISAASKTMNIQAINASARMFEAIAKIAEADGEDAISALARELMVAVKELSETVANMEEVMASQQNNMKDIISGALSTFKEKIFGANKPAGKGGEEESVNMQDVVLAIEALQDRFNYAIPVKNLSS